MDGAINPKRLIKKKKKKVLPQLWKAAWAGKKIYIFNSLY